MNHLKKKPSIPLIIPTLVMVVGLVAACSQNVEQELDTSRAAIKQLGGSLKTELKTSL